jgi:hypothetical protein
MPKPAISPRQQPFVAAMLIARSVAGLIGPSREVDGARWLVYNRAWGSLTTQR